MTYIPPCNESDVFQAVRLGHWKELAERMVENARRSLEMHKKPSAYSSRSAYSSQDPKAQLLLLPNYPMVGVFLMQHKEGSDKLLATLKNDPYIKRMDCSQLVMHLVKTDTSGFIWALNQGWDAHFGLLQSRQVKMNWSDLKATLKTAHERETVDTWMRKWVKRNPMLLANLSTPTFDECKTLIVERLYVSPKELRVLQQNHEFRVFFHALESLGQWDAKRTPEDNAKLLRGYFTQEPVAQLSLPDDFVVEP